MIKLLTIEDVAEVLNVQKHWVYNNWKREEIPFRKIGQALRCRPNDLELWIDRQAGA